MMLRCCNLRQRVLKFNFVLKIKRNRYRETDIFLLRELQFYG